MTDMPTEPTTLDVEIVVPTPIPYCTIRLRTGASVRPGESLRDLADRLTTALTQIAREQTAHVEQELSNVTRRR